MAVVTRIDPEFRHFEGSTVYLPPLWWKRMDAIAKAEGYTMRSQLIVELLKWSLSHPGKPELMPRADVAKKTGSSIQLPSAWWKRLEDQGKPEHMNRNEVIIWALKRAMDEHDREKAEERGSKK